MRRLIIFSLILWIKLIHGNKDFEVHFVRMENMNDTEQLFKYDLKSVEKVDKTHLKVECESDLFVDLDDEWHMWIQAYHNAEGKEEFTDKPAFSLPKKGICKFLDTTYRQYFWDKLKDTSNLPSPETCPIKAGHYHVKEYIFEGERYKFLMKPGMWKVNMFVSQDHEESHITKLGVSVYASITEVQN